MSKLTKERLEEEAQLELIVKENQLLKEALEEAKDLLERCLYYTDRKACDSKYGDFIREFLNKNNHTYIYEQFKQRNKWNK